MTVSQRLAVLLLAVSVALTGTRAQGVTGVSTGARIVYVGTAEPLNFDIFTSDESGNDERRLTTHPERDEYPSWSPDGQFIAFSSNRTGNHHIYTMRADGTDVVQLTTGGADHQAPAWSPDGRLIAFISNRNGIPWGIYTVNVDGSGIKRITTGKWGDHSVSWSPDGKRMAVTRCCPQSWEVWTMNSDGTDSRRLSTMTTNMIGDLNPEWSPDGSRLLFQRVRFDVSEPWKVMSMATDGSDVREIADGFSPSWSPNDERIIFTSVRAGIQQLFRALPDSDEPVQVTHSRFGVSTGRIQPVLLALTASPMPARVTIGSMALFAAHAIGNPVPAVQWESAADPLGPWQAIAGAQTAIYTFTPSLADNDKWYRAVFTNTHGSVASDPARLQMQPVGNQDLVQNGSFANGLSGWSRFAAPDPNDLVSRVTNGGLEFYREPPPEGTTNQAVVLQATGMPLPVLAPIEAQFALGNSSNARKRVAVLIHDADFSDLGFCTFWLPAHQPLATYTMHTYTLRPWTNTTLSFYAATTGSDGGWYQVKNVSMRYVPTGGTGATHCIDPLAPSPGDGADSANLLVNGDFSAGLAPWTTFGTITSRIDAGVFEFVRNPDLPAGVVAQNTGQPAAAGEIFTATLDLGNSSNVRKRVTVLMHDADFSDLTACTFWIPPGQPLLHYVMRGSSTRPWTSTMLSIYGATIGPEPWIRVDNAALRRTPGAYAPGTMCIGGATDEERPAGRAAIAAGGVGSTGRPAQVVLPRKDTAIDAADFNVVELTDAIDLTDVSNAHLRFGSWLDVQGSRAEVQVRVANGPWETIAQMPASDDWVEADLDLAEYAGHAIQIRFVLHQEAPSAEPGGSWRLRDIRIETPTSRSPYTVRRSSNPPRATVRRRVPPRRREHGSP